MDELEAVHADEVADTNTALFRIQMLAKGIRNNRELRRVVRSAEPPLQEGVYAMIVPHLKFTPLPFERINSHR